MNIFLFENKTEDKWLYDRLNRLLPEHKFIVVEVNESLATSYYFDILAMLKEQNLKFDLFLIPVSLGNIHSEFLGLKLGLLIRLAFEFSKYCLKPIIFIGAENKDELLKYSSFAQVLNTKGAYYCRYSLEELKKSIEKVGIFTNEEIIKSLLEEIRLEKPPMNGRHSIANEWAIYRMTYVLNCLKSIEKSGNFSSIIHHPYFRFLLNQIHYQRGSEKIDITPIFQNIHTNESKFLLIDDKSKIGWERTLEIIVERLNPKNKISSYSNFPEDKFKFIQSTKEIINQIELNDYDLIFLDLRLLSSEEDKSFKDISDIENFSGAKILTQIKDKFPALPVIIFTASQQAWNLEKLYDIGADGYFIKESPENIFSDEIFYDNLRNFIQNIVNLTVKGKVLKWFFSNSSKIKEKIKKENFSLNIQKRLAEKFDISFGLMRSKRNKYDKQYLFTDYELAFLVYWSCLNEFHAEKLTYYNGNSPDYQFKSGKYLIQNSSTVFKRISSKEFNHKKFIKWINRFGNSKQHANYKLLSTPVTLSQQDKLFYKDNLSNLIPAYILLELDQKYHYLIEDFVFLNEIRNHLDFTHSDEKAVFNYSIEKNRNEIQALEDTKDMFKFIYFLFAKEQL